MITRRWPEVGWIVTGEDIDEERMKMCMELMSDGLLDLLEEIEDALSEDTA